MRSSVLDDDAAVISTKDHSWRSLMQRGMWRFFDSQPAMQVQAKTTYHVSCFVFEAEG